MKNVLVIICLSFTVACAQKEPAKEEIQLVPVNPEISLLKVSMYDSDLIDYDIANSHPYDVDFKVEKGESGKYMLITSMKLHGGSFFVSPITDKGFKGKFRVEVAPNDDLSIGDDVVETPKTKTVFDPHRFINGPVNWVTEDTRYDFPLIVNSNRDFEIGGKLIFVIEPKCTLEEIPVMFKYKNGVLTVEKWMC